uniref:Uncharacterized protein LOC104238371 n=1 Tax=Nicotiana sylvestris TaxID=4096 RepID=A0A1U7XVM5_NICSY|nr:PREDICTED: uncharacterized protein LOC104238371 [Nicotiana sylvestris]
MVTVRSVITVAASKHWHIYPIDVHNAFLQGDLFEEVYMQGGVQEQSVQAKEVALLLEASFKTIELEADRIYVDDLLVTGNNPKLIQSARENLQKKFKMKDLGELRFFLGIEFPRNKAGILMNQRKYALDLITDSGLGGARPASTTLECNQRLTTTEYDKVVLGSEDATSAGVKDHVFPDPEPYQRKSVTGYLVRCMASIVAEVSWLVGLFKELGIQIQLPIPLNCDSNVAIQIAANPIFHERTKHIDNDCNFMREKMQQGLIQTHHINTKLQLAAILTKGLWKGGIWAVRTSFKVSGNSGEHRVPPETMPYRNNSLHGQSIKN